ncbi:hypothetical protein QTL97_16885 [Sporosarcina thermotolerans]|uniref:YozE SAM-like domain-containing protein n=1 Tax=Sporosarcina thermotolerans TaxID=633404 RepID=A0AAW9AG27_9BACL|nr:hypothetical protein [Sporosarcina thermotolerans]MDW0118603.1 hypothetical protein [Sporosarcina thermotolerans]WHT49606.1 hypothetical protein QNH10_08930 [Sporosarcina thermotolerans]
MLRKDDENFEGQFPDGVFAIPKDNDEPRIKVRALFNYCEQRGITPDQLSCEELEKFMEK